MPDATTQPALLLETHRNHNLFSDYYLNHRARERPEWQAASADAAAALAQIAGRWRRFTPGQASEAQLEDEWIRPVLRLLGHTFNVQVSVRTPLGTRAPDYIFYPDEAARVAARQGVLEERDLRGALAVGDAKAWERPLDQSPRGRGARAAGQISENPSVQIDFYIRHTGLPWGILTNGRAWRLYHHESSKRLDVFYEVDLPALIEQGDVEAFKYFFLFFRRAAFSGAPAWLDLVLRESHAYEQGVSQNLKEQVYEALRALAQGFLDFPANRLDPTPETLRAIYDNSLIVLYRLLFILYAESRGLLPVHENQAYTESYSLHALKQRVARDMDLGRPVVASMARLWESLRELWAVLASGNADLGVPPYNGGLFDPQRHPFLEQYRVGDAALRRAIDLLARTVDPATGRRELVDYRDLEVRHLGSIYEGLLEYQLRYAEVPLALRREKGRELYVPQDEGEGGQIAVRAGETYLVTDKGERKATGSYYTPDYIVQYIVEQTVGPVLEAIRARHAGDERALVRAVLGVNVLDPAMGSGHFLVAATDFIARFLVGLGLEAAADLGAEAELAYWRRRVAQACIYGVDLNPLAVELAKLSLWLATVARDKPLSFLDHHLRCGNSLVGARVEALPLDGAPAKSGRGRERRERAAREAGQLSMLDDSAFAASMRTATRFMADIEALRSETLDEVHAAERIYRDQVRDTTRAARTLADIWTARHFGLEVDDQLWRDLARHVLHGGFEVPQYAGIVARARQIAAERRFFHWELEFPEVFFDESGRLVADRAGFDAVVGNPPYVRQEALAALKPYFARAHSAVYDGVADLYVYFYHQGLEVLRPGGYLSYIVTNKWLRAGYGEALRGYFVANAEVRQIVDFGHAPIFPDADVFPCIVVLRKPGADGEANVQTDVCLFPRAALGQVGLPDYVRAHSYHVPARRFTRQPWSLEPAEVGELMAKIRRVGVPLAEFAGAKPYRGVVTGCNEAFLVDTAAKERLIREDPRSAEIIRPYLRGQDIWRWMPEWQGLWMIFTRRGIDIDAYPSIRKYLEQFRELLEPRPKLWQGANWLGRKPGPYQWYEIQDSVEYWELFTKPKILYQEIQFHSWFALDQHGYFTNNKVFLIPAEDRYLLAVLNSPLMWWHNWRYLPHMKDEALSPVGELMEDLPIAPATDEVRAAVEPIVEHLITLTKEQRATRNDVLDWLRVEFGIENAGQKLEAFASLDEATFLEEAKKRRRRSAGRLSPAGLRALRDAYAEHTPHIRALEAEAQQLEQRLAALVNKAYGLTPEDEELLWRTAPPRMPVGRPK